MNSTREDMTQAVLEGVAFGIRDSLEAVKELGIQVNNSTICGGGAKSPLWKRYSANVLNIELITQKQNKVQDMEEQYLLLLPVENMLL